MTEQVVQIPFVTTGFIKFAPMLLRYKTGYRQQELKAAVQHPNSRTGFGSRSGGFSSPPCLGFEAGR